MKILCLGLDNSILDKNSPLAKRVVKYGELVEKYTVVVPSREDKTVDLSERVRAIGINAPKKIIALLKIYKIAKNLLIGKKYDIITVQDQYYLALIGWLLATKYKIGLEIQVHGFEKYYGLRKMIAKYVLPRANAVRVVSERLEKQLVGEFGVKSGRITIVPVYSEIRNPSNSAGKQELGIRNYEIKDKFVFLTVGRLVPVKNIEMQIRALANIIKQYPNIELWVIGSGPEEEKLKVLSFKFQVSGNVKFFGWQDDLDKFYKQADAFLLTSDSEGWGMAVIEAASYGLPIIMTDVGCAGEVIVNGESGMVIPVGDQGKLEESMLKLIEDKELRRKLGENARQAVLTLPNKEETLALYKKSWENALKFRK